MDIVTIHPAFVLGPVLSQRTDATSVSSFKVCALLALSHKAVPRHVACGD